MGDCKRSSPTMVAMNEEPSPNATSISKKRKITASHFNHLSSQNHQQLPTSLPHSPENTLSPVTLSNSTATVASDEIRSDRTSLPLFSSSKVNETGDVDNDLDITQLDPEVQTNGLETVDSTNRNSKSLSLLSEICEDSEARALVAKTEVDIDEFFARFERGEQKRFAKKYNFDIFRDRPLEGRYEWVRLH